MTRPLTILKQALPFVLAMSVLASCFARPISSNRIALANATENDSGYKAFTATAVAI